MDKHYPVMLNEIVESLNIKPDGIYVDLTLGRGGHSKKILEKLTTGMLYSFDKDLQAIRESEPLLSKVNKNFKLIHSDYKHFKDELEKLGIVKVDGIIADIGVSSPQIDDPDRGFSYNKNARLDMRMDQTQSMDAHHLVNNASVEELIYIFKQYADVMLPQRVAKGILVSRPIDTTNELVEVIKESLPAPIVRKKNPAKSVFQAIRIAVNGELDALKELLEIAPNMLKKDGRLAIITFHSIEDRMVKHSFAKFIKDDTGKLPIIIEKKFSVKTKTPSKREINENKRSRSAKLRILQKIAD